VIDDGNPPYLFVAGPNTRVAAFMYSTSRKRLFPDLCFGMM
jgi:hypothetical protein